MLGGGKTTRILEKWSHEGGERESIVLFSLETKKEDSGACVGKKTGEMGGVALLEKKKRGRHPLVSGELALY